MTIMSFGKPPKQTFPKPALKVNVETIDDRFCRKKIQQAYLLQTYFYKHS